MATSLEDAADFLKRVKRTLSQSKADSSRFVFANRDKNMTTQAALEYTREDVKRALLELSAEDYCRGPDRDVDIAGEVWVFGKTIRGMDIYIKLKLAGDSHAEGVRLISFHTAESQLHFPFRVQKYSAKPACHQED